MGRSDADYDFLNQLSFTNQLMLARKFSSDLSLVLLPTHIHRNVVEYGQPFDPWVRRTKSPKKYRLTANTFTL